MLLLWYHSISTNVTAYYELIRRIETLWTSNGKQFVVLYLKEATRLCQFYIAGNPTSSNASTRVASRSGLPTLLPSDLRRDFHNPHSDSRISWKVVLAVLSLYRVIKVPGKLKLSTITDPFSGISTTLNVGELGYVWATRFSQYNIKKQVGQQYLLPMRTAGPNNKISMLAAPLDAMVMAIKNPGLRQNLSTINSYFGAQISKILDREIDFISLLPTELIRSKEVAVYQDKLSIGKLSLKEEAAGKIRVFAIGDI